MLARLRAFRNALIGVVRCFRSEAHARFHATVAVLVICAAFLLRAGADDWCWFVLCIGWVTAAELVNTSVERLADRVSADLHPLIRDAKDMAAGAVLMVSVASVIIGVIRFWPLLLNAWHGIPT